jgi:hypothetical protein
MPTVYKFWEPEPPGALRTCTGLEWDSFLLKGRACLESTDKYVMFKRVLKEIKREDWIEQRSYTVLL